jgi:hypothetical protein
MAIQDPMTAIYTMNEVLKSKLKLKLKLKLSHSFVNLAGMQKMIEMLAVDLFTFENIYKLWIANHLMVQYYLFLFIYWYEAMSIKAIVKRLNFSC